MVTAKRRGDDAIHHDEFLIGDESIHSLAQNVLHCHYFFLTGDGHDAVTYRDCGVVEKYTMVSMLSAYAQANISQASPT